MHMAFLCKNDHKFDIGCGGLIRASCDTGSGFLEDILVT